MVAFLYDLPLYLIEFLIEGINQIFLEIFMILVKPFVENTHGYI